MSRTGPRRFRYAVLSALLLATALPSTARNASREGVVLAVRGDVGQIARYRTKVKVQLAVEGQKFDLEIDQTERAKVVTVADDGRVTFERKVEAMEQRINGEKMDADPSDDVSTVTLNSDGTLAEYKSDDEPEQRIFSIRLGQAGAAVFLATEVAPGSKWSHTFVADPKLGNPAAKADYTYEADEQAAGADCAKITLKYAETGAKGLTNQATLWVEKASGDVVKTDFAMTNVPFPGGEEPILATASGTMVRTEGGLVLAEGAEPAAEQAKPKTIDETVEGYEKIPGQFTFYRKQESGSTEILMEIPTALLGKDVMLQATAKTGTSSELVAGDPVSDLLFQFREIRKDKLVMYVPNRLFRARSGYEVQRAVERSFADSMLEQFDIKARQEDRASILVDVSDFFIGDISQIESRFEGGGIQALLGGGGGRSYSLDRSTTFVASVKSFPENAVVEASFNFVSSGGATLEDMIAPTSADPRSVVVRVVYNLWAVPEADDYVPRTGDARVGYFGITFQDFTRDRDRDQTRTWINRWNLRKKDPSAAVSEPVKPIVFWLDNAIPVKYREAVRNSLLMWNAPLELAGFKDAIQVRQMSDEPEFEIGDMRYNTVLWVASPGSAYAVANFRVHPSTGEIINAGIVVDANIMRAATGELETSVVPLARRLDPRACDCLHAGLEVAGFGFEAASALAEPGAFDEEDYVRQFVEAFVVHEMGHILGLRHNFVSTTQLTLEELADPQVVAQKSTSASVMDYVPFNISALGKKGVPFYGPGLGDYDVWAIQYGYADFGEPGSRAEARALAEWAAQGAKDGLGYQSDEAADGFDPYVTRFDLGADPLEYWTKTVAMSKRLLATLPERSPRPGRSYYDFTRSFNRLLAMVSMGANQKVRFVGGLRRHANFKGDPGEKEPIEPVAPEVQRRAFQAVLDGVLAPGAVSIPKGHLTKFAPNPDAGLLESFLGGSNPHNVLSDLAGIQADVVASLLASDRLTRVVNNEFKAKRGTRPFTLVELFDGLEAALWKELESGQEIDAVRRAVQRQHVDTLARYFVNPPAGLPQDARMLSLRSLKSLGKRVALAARTAPGPYGQAHLEDILARISRALNAVQTVGAQGGRAPSSLLELLGGG